ncbi:hypothetical protein GCM10007879_07480 [Maritalea porphyrae]|uniref:Uncharacterized protein n=1 Tax=Maritalea porphyrae TaxID=880732 RepID=A0ABQ5UPZ7_9HYPH|nr:hypothetical protein GCM10007879_07480 [Maritalea porphyrae]
MKILARICTTVGRLKSKIRDRRALMSEIIWPHITFSMIVGHLDRIENAKGAENETTKTNAMFVVE